MPARGLGGSEILLQEVSEKELVGSIGDSLFEFGIEFDFQLLCQGFRNSDVLEHRWG
jgi:predicted SpoU family rRNA methylase